MRKFKVAGIQMAPEAGNVDANLEKAIRFIKNAAGKGAKLVCLPELFSTGYDPEFIKKTTAEYPDEVSMKFAEIACNNSIYMVAGVPVRSDGDLYNAALLWGPDGNLLGKYYKSHLISTDDLNEPGYFSRGDQDYAVYHTEIGKIGMMICYDLRYPELARKLALNGAELVVAPSAWPKVRESAFKTLSAARALENQYFLLAVNQAGGGEDKRFGGGTALYDPKGDAISPGPAGEEEAVVVSEIDLDFLDETRKKMDCLGGRFNSYGL